MEREQLVVNTQDASRFALAVSGLGLPTALEGGDHEIDANDLKQTLTWGLALINPKQPLGTELFSALARLTVTVAVEAVALRYTPAGDAVEVLLTQRAANDPAYPGQWHCPGTALRPGEVTEDAFRRLNKGEFFLKMTAWTQVGTWNNPHEQRGHFLHLVYICRVTEGARGKWFPVGNLPGCIVGHHRDHIIPMALTAFGKLTTQ